MNTQFKYSNIEESESGAACVTFTLQSKSSAGSPLSIYLLSLFSAIGPNFLELFPDITVPVACSDGDLGGFSTGELSPGMRCWTSHGRKPPGGYPRQEIRVCYKYLPILLHRSHEIASRRASFPYIYGTFFLNLFQMGDSE